MNFEQMEQVNGGDWVCSGALFAASTPWLIGFAVAGGPIGIVGGLITGAVFMAVDKVVCN